TPNTGTFTQINASGRVIGSGGLAASTGLGVSTGALGAFEARSQGSGGTAGAAYIAFHRPNAYAAYLGLDTDNQWKVGGWSAGNNAYRIWHEGLFTPVNKAGDTMTGNLL